MRSDLHQDSVNNIQSALANGWIRAACIISNATLPIFSRRVANLAGRCGLPHLSCHWPYPMKPSLKAFDTAAALIAPAGSDRSRIMMVGDQLGTDMAARRHGYKTLLVPTLEPIPWWKQWKHNKEDQIRRDLVVIFPCELRRG
ncbi:MAG: HAD hydrolase-like protein [Patescibacteria group bacterium]